MEGRFNIRVYGLLLDKGRVLVTDEFRLGIMMTKFPGGGLIYGEGIVDCLRREFMEELGIELTEIQHYYTTEDFVETRLLPYESQLISVYYKVKSEQSHRFTVTETPFDFKEPADGAQCFRWMDIREMDPESFTFPVDRRVAKKLKEEDV